MTFRFNPKLTAVAKKNSYILNLDELPLKLNSSSVFNQTLATDVLENALCLTKVNFIEKNKK